MPLAHTRSRRAFTLIEAICTMIVIGVIGGVVASIILRSSRSYIEIAQRARLHDELASALDRIERELREIPLSSGATTPALSSVTSTSVTWTRSSVACSLSLSGTNLSLTDTSAVAGVLLPDVTAVTITAYDESNAALTLPLSGSGCNAVRRLQLSITVSRQGLSDTLRCKVFIRSTMEGAQG